jgi:hypothetical protein
MLIAVAGLVVLAAEWAVFSSPGKAALDNAPAAGTPDIVISMQAGDGSVCVVHLEFIGSDRPGPAAASVAADIRRQLPDSMTLMLLGFGGLLYHHRKGEKFRPACLRIA